MLDHSANNDQVEVSVLLRFGAKNWLECALRFNTSENSHL